MQTFHFSPLGQRGALGWSRAARPWGWGSRIKAFCAAAKKHDRFVPQLDLEERWQKNGETASGRQKGDADLLDVIRGYLEQGENQKSVRSKSKPEQWL